MLEVLKVSSPDLCKLNHKLLQTRFHRLKAINNISKGIELRSIYERVREVEVKWYWRLTCLRGTSTGMEESRKETVEAYMSINV